MDSLKKQRGATLLVSLILLLLLTVLALSQARTAALQQRMSSNLQQQTQAFQAAESGIAAAILRLRGEPQKWPTNIGDKKGLCAASGSLADWSNSACTLSGDEGYQVLIERMPCNNNDVQRVCFDIHSAGIYIGHRVEHQQGYIFSIDCLDSDQYCG